MNFLSLIVSTFVLRPYVLAFFLAFLACSLKVFGWRRALLYIAYAFPVSLLLEIASTRWGFPFGIYVYHVENTAGKELWLAGIPFMSTLSFVFLGFFSYRLAVYFFTKSPLAWPFLTAAAMFLVDFVIDPVTVLGDRWFLGDLYHYPEKGFYFGVPFVNFLGWAFIGFVLSFPFAVEDFLKGREAAHWKENWRWDYIAGWTYIGAMFFMSGVAFWIGEDRLGVIGASLGAGIGLCLSFRKKYLLDQELIIEEPTVAAS